MSKVKVCEKDYCDYAPCVEEKIRQLELDGLDAADQKAWLEKVRLSDAQEAIWLAEHNEGLDEKAAIV